MTTCDAVAEALPHAVEACLSLPGIDVEVHRYSQPGPLQAVLEVPRHTLSMSLIPQVRYSRGRYFDEDDRQGPWADVGEVTFSPQGTRLMVLAPGGAPCYRGIYLTFATSFFEETTDLRGAWSVQQLRAMLDVRLPSIKRDLYRILKEVSEDRPGRMCIVDAISRAVLVDLARHLRAASEPVRTERASLARWQLRRITDYVESMVDHCPDVGELSGLCEISPRHLSRAFKATTGQTVGEYVAGVRMMKARSLLAHTDLALKEIAHRLGFSGSSSFCVAFTKAVGMTPHQYRINSRTP